MRYPQKIQKNQGIKFILEGLTNEPACRRQVRLTEGLDIFTRFASNV